MIRLRFFPRDEYFAANFGDWKEKKSLDEHAEAFPTSLVVDYWFFFFLLLPLSAAI